MIPLNDFRRQWERTRAGLHEALDRVGSSGWYILGREVADFERALAGWWGAPAAVGVASGQDALEIGLRVLGVRPGDPVLTTPLSAFATTLAILKAGAKPVFVDIGDNGLIRLDRCREILATRPEIRFLLPVHLYGQALDDVALRDLRARYEVRVLEDCAQSIGATFGGRPTGLAGDLAATSFYPTKNLGALGDGGAILAAEPAHAAAARSLRDYGQSAKYIHEVVGFNSRLDELQAAFLGRVLLPELTTWTARRRAIAREYREGISHPGIRLLEPPPAADPCWHLFPVFVDPARKGDFRRHLESRGVASGEHYPRLIPGQKALAGAAFEMADPCSTAARLAQSEVSLPIHPFLTGEEVGRVIAACNAWR